jgi:hypothetical protein
MYGPCSAVRNETIKDSRKDIPEANLHQRQEGTQEETVF